MLLDWYPGAQGTGAKTFPPFWGEAVLTNGGSIAVPAVSPPRSGATVRDQELQPPFGKFHAGVVVYRLPHLFERGVSICGAEVGVRVRLAHELTEPWR